MLYTYLGIDYAHVVWKCGLMCGTLVGKYWPRAGAEIGGWFLDTCAWGDAANAYVNSKIARRYTAQRAVI